MAETPDDPIDFVKQLKKLAVQYRRHVWHGEGVQANGVVEDMLALIESADGTDWQTVPNHGRPLGHTTEIP